MVIENEHPIAPYMI